jgi:hypothetical protein
MLGADLDADLAVAGELGGVAEEVVEDLAEAGRIGDELAGEGVDGELEGVVVGLEIRGG